VPAPTAGAVTLSDTVDDLTTTGTVTFSNPSFDLVGTGGMVTVRYEPGTAGGSITNCAHLTSSSATVTSGGFTFPAVTGVDLQACDTQVVDPRACIPGAPGCGWEDGDMVTYEQNRWGEPTSIAGQLLGSYFDSVYFAIGGVLEVGGFFTMTFQSATAVWSYQPSAGTPAPLNANLIDPISSASGQFGGEIVALKLNIDFSDSGHISGAVNVPFGNLTLCNFVAPDESLNGTSVRSFLATGNVALGGGATTIPIAELNLIALNLNASFDSGAVNLFAQQHLVNGPCGWADGDVITHTQVAWGDPTSTAGILLYGQYDYLYFGTGGVLEVGVLGAAGFSLAFTSATGVLGYLPAIGNVGALNADLVDPGTSASGAFGGEVVALRLNIDFAAAGHTVGNSGLLLSELTMCGFASNPALNGMGVSDFLAILNAALGGGPAPYTIAVLHLIAEQVNAAFNDGTPSLFAQQHLFNGACPP
jgi:hypothetical protein